MSNYQEQYNNKWYNSGNIKAITAFFANYVNFTGRSNRREFWWWFLWDFIAEFIISFQLVSVTMSSWTRWETTQNPEDFYAIITHFMASYSLAQIWACAIILPTLALGVRRFRDAGIHWGWFVGLTATPIVLTIFMFNQILVKAINNQAVGSIPFYSCIILACIVAKLVISLLKSKQTKEDTQTEPDDVKTPEPKADDVKTPEPKTDDVLTSEPKTDDVKAKNLVDK